MILTILKDIIPIVEKGAPLLAAVLSGNFWQAGLSLLSTHFGVHPDNVEALKSIIQNNNDSMDKIKECELNNKEALTQLANQSMQMELLDVQNARDFSLKDNKTRVWLIRALIIGLIVTITGLFLIHDRDVDHVLMILSWTLITELRIIYRAEFGGKV